MLFSEFEIEDGTLDAIVAMGYEEPTPIQEQAISPLLSGRDVVGQARTGTGKTAAFGIPLVNRYRGEHDGVLGLVLVPTRELAIQVAEVLTEIAKASKLNIVTVYGGAGFGKQNSDLGRRGAKIVVATPGRLLDHLDRGTLHLEKVGFWVLDEADRMLDMGFVRDMRKVRSMLNTRDLQTALFSATIPDDVRKLIKEFTVDAVNIRVEDGEATIPKAEQFVSKVEKTEKQKVLLHLLHEEQPARAVVFTRTKHLAKRLSKKLDSHGWSSVALQGNMSQGQRERAMEDYRGGKARVLVATDVAARGLDVPGITHVVNFDLPDPEQYVHRVGRTARNGADGKAYTFVQSDEHKDLRIIEKFAGRRLDDIQFNAPEESPRGPDKAAQVPDMKVANTSGWSPRSGGQGQRRNQGRSSGGGHGGGHAGGHGGGHGGGDSRPSSGGGQSRHGGQSRGPRTSGGQSGGYGGGSSGGHSSYGSADGGGGHSSYGGGGDGGGRSSYGGGGPSGGRGHSGGRAQSGGPSGNRSGGRSHGGGGRNGGGGRSQGGQGRNGSGSRRS